MPAFFNLTLDTTGPGGVTIDLASGANFTAVRAITAALGTTDGVTTGYQMKIWGSVDSTVNANIQTTEAASAWITYSPTQAVTLSTGDALKTVNVKIRDDVSNEATVATDTITLDSTVPVITITGPDVPKISKIAGRRVASLSFSSDVAISAYKVKVVPSSASLENAGTQVGVVSGSTNMSGAAVAAATTVNATIDGADLESASAGDGAKVIKVFGQETGSGSWSV